MMRKMIITSLILGLALLWWTQVDARTRVGVIELKKTESISEETGQALTDVLRAALFETGEFDVINREDMKELLTEEKFQQTYYCDKTSCIVQMGKWLGVPKMVTGKLSKLGKTYIVTLKLVDVETARNEKIVSESCKCEIDQMVDIIHTATGGLVGKAHAKQTSPKNTPTIEQKSRFTSNGNGTITDNENGVMWASSDSFIDTHKCLTWFEAKEYVDDLTTGGYTDWRLPTMKELGTLFSKDHTPRKAKFDNGKYTVYLPSVFSKIGTVWLWSNETSPHKTQNARFFDFHLGMDSLAGDKNKCRMQGVLPIRTIK